MDLLKGPGSAPQASVGQAEEAAIGPGLKGPVSARGALDPAVMYHEGYVLGSDRNHRWQGNDYHEENKTGPSQPVDLVNPFFFSVRPGPHLIRLSPSCAESTRAFVQFGPPAAAKIDRPSGLIYSRAIARVGTTPRRPSPDAQAAL